MSTNLGIVPDPYGGLYLGGTFNHYVDEEHLYCFEDWASRESGKDIDVDITTRFLSFASIQGGYAFPTKQEIATVYRRGGVFFLKLEPWSSAGPDDSSFNLQDLLDGKYDKQLKAFAKAAKKQGIPLFVTFGHEPQVTDKYPWGKDPELYKAAFRYVHDKVSEEYGADNITWVWNPNVNIAGRPDLLAYDPNWDTAANARTAKSYYTYIALDGYHPRSGQTFAAIFGPSLAQIYLRYEDKSNGYKPEIIIGEFASSIADRAQIFDDAMNYIVNNGTYRIFAYLYYDMDDDGNAFSITNPKDKADFAAALKKQDDLWRVTHRSGLFESTIQLSDGTALEQAPIDPPQVNCAEIEGWWYSPYWKERVDLLEMEIRLKENCFSGLVEDPASKISVGHYCDATQPNTIHELLAKAYVEMAILRGRNKNLRDELIKRAEQHVEDGLNTHDPGFTHWNWPPIERTNNYFDLLLRRAEIYRDYGRILDSMSLCERVLSNTELYSPKVQAAHDIGEESIEGIEARTRCILADDLMIQGSPQSLRRAMSLYNQVIRWAKREVSPAPVIWKPRTWGAGFNWFYLFWKHGKGKMDITPAPEVQYIGALAQLGKAEILARQHDLPRAFQLYRAILNWEMVGQKGFLRRKVYLDLAFKAFIGAMTACASTGNYQEAIQMFNDNLPWQKINEYDALKDGLGMQGVDLVTISPRDRWELFKNRLNLTPLDPRYDEKMRNLLAVSLR